MYAIVRTGGKQYRVERGQSLLVERLPVEDGGSATLEPLLYVDGDNIVDGDGLAKVSVQARVVGHERGPKLRVVKFKPKRGYKRRTGHRQELTRIEVTEIKLGERRAGSRRSPKPAPAESEAGGAAGPPEAAAGGTQAGEAQAKPGRRKAAPKADSPKPRSRPESPRRKRPSTEPEAGDGA